MEHPFILLSLLVCLAVVSARLQQSTTYIVHVSKSDIPATFATHKEWYTASLASVKGLQVEDLLPEHGPLYTYDLVFHGFAAKLTSSQAVALEQIPGFLMAFPDSAARLHTTHTPDFMKLNTIFGLLPSFDYGDDVIVGVLDTGVWPERQSFRDHNLGPVPDRWKGECEIGTAFNSSLCNKKLVGARIFYKGYEAASGPINETIEYKSARDVDGHGTHTSSTAAGSYVYNASLLGYAQGIARGMAPRARIAVYKVCWVGGCFNSDILAAFDSAVADGVNVISLSVGGGALPYFLDSIAIGAFGAMEKDVLVSCSAGNGGPDTLTVANVAPWILTVAASSVDRDFPAPVTLGNGATFAGVSLYNGKGLGSRQVPLIYAGDVGLKGNSSAYLCMSGTLNPNLVAGKIVLCDRGINARVNKGMVVQQAGGMGMILANAQENGEELAADSHVLPAAIVGFKEGAEIKAYIANATIATANIAFEGTRLGIKPAPVMAAFSSRGPNPVTQEILKPDITAPGVNILAAWTGAIGPTGLSGDNRVVDFNIISGTSMSCPHASGLAALLKGAHPDWSPAAIKSALMTTATVIDNSGSEIRDGSTSKVSTPLCHGAGHVNLEAALDPGLLYDLGVQDYVDFLCSLNYASKELQVFTKGKYSCSTPYIKPLDLNYPAFSLVFNQNISSKYFATVARTVKNVGAANSVYSVHVSAPKGVSVNVEPQKLIFKLKNERLSYKVTFKASPINLQPQQDFINGFGSLTWTDGRHNVKSPIVFSWL